MAIRMWASIALVLVLAVATWSANADKIPVFKVSAVTHEQFGRAVGARFADRIHIYLNQSSTLHSQLLPLISKPAGKALFDKYVASSRAAFPQYYEELVGISVGAGVPTTYLLLLELQDELLEFDGLLATKDSIPASALACSDIHVHTATNHVFGHNEDSSKLVKDWSYILDAEIGKRGTNDFEAYTAYTYPGMLSGLAFGWNEHGIAISCNAVFPRDVNKGGIGRAFINRGMLAATSINDALQRATPAGRALGFSFNMGSVAEKTIVNVEVAPTSYAFTTVVGNFSHFNMYKVLVVPQLSDISTIHRQARANQIAAPTSGSDILRILGDTQDKQWPIYRTGVAPDTGYTVASALFNLDNRTVSIWDSNPELTAPIWIFPL